MLAGYSCETAQIVFHPRGTLVEITGPGGSLTGPRLPVTEAGLWGLDPRTTELTLQVNSWVNLMGS